MSKRRIYLSGPMTGCARAEYVRRFREAERILRRHGYGCINPCRVWACRWPWIYRAMEWAMGKRLAYAACLCYDLNVHHIRYLSGHKPWEYEDGDLITLCGKCHKKWHEEIEGMHYDCAKCKHFHHQYYIVQGDSDEWLFDIDGTCKEFGGIGCNFKEATMCEECAFQSGCKAGDEDIACDKFRQKTCLSCLHFRIDGDESFDGHCLYSGNEVYGGDFCDNCNKQNYSPAALNIEDLKKYISDKGWD